MDFERFKEWAKEEILERISLDIDESDIELHEVSKLGRKYTGLAVSRGECLMSPVVDLEAFYEMYSEGINSDRIADMMTSLIEDHMPECSIDMEWISEYPKVRDKLIVCLSNAESNSLFLKDVPHILKEDLALTCHIIYELPGEGRVGAVVSNSMMEEYGIGPDTLFEDAMESSMRLLPLRTELVREMLDKGEEYDEDNPFSRLMMISNSKLFRGASALFYPEVLEKVAGEIGGSYYVLPSSIHEVLALPVTDDTDVEDLELMVLEANLLHVPPEERLSDGVYMYDALTRNFRKVSPDAALN